MMLTSHLGDAPPPPPPPPGPVVSPVVQPIIVETRPAYPPYLRVLDTDLYPKVECKPWEYSTHNTCAINWLLVVALGAAVYSMVRR